MSSDKTEKQQRLSLDVIKFKSSSNKQNLPHLYKKTLVFSFIFLRTT